MTRLVMTLLVRDELEIIRENIDFHLKQGVDYIIATDNGSIDGTREILAEYAQQGVLTVIDEPGRDYFQSRWVTRMAHLAREEYGADWILNCDADEFWTSTVGDLKQELLNTKANMIVCSRRQMFYPHDAPTPQNIFEDIRWRMAHPLSMSRFIQSFPVEAPYCYFDLPPKVLCRAVGLEEVAAGNHSANYAIDSKECSSHVTFYHYSMRGFEHFVRKILVGGAAYANSDHDEALGWHWRRWYKMIQNGCAREAYQETMPSRAQMECDLQSGLVLCDSTMRLEGSSEARTTGNS